jgi:hypothetical protein
MSDPDMSVLIDTFRLTAAFLQQGTDENIRNYFGLKWNSTSERWDYVAHGAGTSLAGSIATIGGLTSSREPDFFELLQAGILNASLGSSSTADPALPVAHQQSKTLHILTVGANLVAQSRADSYPVRIAFANGAVEMEAVGSSRLPYVNSLAACPVGTTQPAGGMHWLLVPNLWDPFRDNWDLTQANTGGELTPVYPRPAVRIRVSGTVAFGSVPGAPPVTTGSLISGSAATIFPTGSLVVPDLTLTLAPRVGNDYGRDGFLEAYRMRTNDISGAVPQYTITNSPTTSLVAWNSLTTTGMPGVSQRWIVLRLSLAGTDIPPSAFTSAQHPILILKPGFRLTLDYESPNGAWYTYSSLQGNNAATTWIGNSSPPQDFGLVTAYSVYGKPNGTTPTIVTTAAASTATPWATATLAESPTFAKADPRSIRFNSQIGVVSVPAPPLTSASAGVVGSIWPSAFATPPPMSTSGSSSGNPNPAMSVLSDSDNAPAGSNPYSETVSNAASVRGLVMNRPFRSVGEMAYAFRDQPFRTLDFSSTNSPDAGLLDLFTVSEYSAPEGMRAGVVNLNTRQSGSLFAILKGTVHREETARVSGASASPSPSPGLLTDTPAADISASLTH